MLSCTITVGNRQSTVPRQPVAVLLLQNTSDVATVGKLTYRIVGGNAHVTELKFSNMCSDVCGSSKYSSCCKIRWT